MATEYGKQPRKLLGSQTNVCHQQQAIVGQHRVASFHGAGDTDQDEDDGHLVGLQIVKRVNPPLVGVG